MILPSFVTRRQFVRAGLAGIAGTLAAGCQVGPTEQPGIGGDARLRVSPRAPTQTLSPGTHTLDAAIAGSARLHVPAGYDPAHPAPLFVMLHGAGASREQMHLFYPYADRHGLVFLVPFAAGRTWDMVLGAFGADVRMLGRALEYTFDHCAIDPARVIIGGFSDGGSYALSLGLTNGDLFSRVVAFSPGFMMPPKRVGKPRVFVAHGTQDEVLPIGTTGRPIAAQLRAWDYDLTYREFEGPHPVTAAVATEAFTWSTAA